ncbi:MAG: hypothetical protein PHF84_10925, partial [bacterium]|nr:hypothetical protein [bacterium]
VKSKQRYTQEIKLLKRDIEKYKDNKEMLVILVRKRKRDSDREIETILISGQKEKFISIEGEWKALSDKAVVLSVILALTPEQEERIQDILKRAPGSQGMRPGKDRPGSNTGGQESMPGQTGQNGMSRGGPPAGGPTGGNSTGKGSGSDQVISQIESLLTEVQKDVLDDIKDNIWEQASGSGMPEQGRGGPPSGGGGMGGGMGGSGMPGGF